MNIRDWNGHVPDDAVDTDHAERNTKAREETAPHLLRLTETLDDIGNRAITNLSDIGNRALVTLNAILARLEEK